METTCSSDVTLLPIQLCSFPRVCVSAISDSQGYQIERGSLPLSFLCYIDELLDILYASKNQNSLLLKCQTDNTTPWVWGLTGGD